MLKRTRRAPSLVKARPDIEEALIKKYAEKYDVDPETLRAEFEKKKDSEEEEEEEFLGAEMFEEMFGMARRRDREMLEDRGILIFNSFISKDTLARINRRMMVLHFDKDFKDDIQLIINSPGGYTDAGWALIDTMRFVKNRVITIAMGEICSMATSIFIAGDERIMAPNSTAMIHQFSGYASGTYGDLVAGRKMEDMEQAKDVAHLMQCSKYTTEGQVKKHILKDHDHWLSPKEMKKHGLCDKIYKPKKLPPGKKGK